MVIVGFHSQFPLLHNQWRVQRTLNRPSNDGTISLHIFIIITSLFIDLWIVVESYTAQAHTTHICVFVWPGCVHFRFTRDTLSAPQKYRFLWMEKKWYEMEKIWFMGILWVEVFHCIWLLFYCFAICLCVLTIIRRMAVDQSAAPFIYRYVVVAAMKLNDFSGFFYWSIVNNVLTSTSVIVRPVDPSPFGKIRHWKNANKAAFSTTEMLTFRTLEIFSSDLNR